MQPHAHGARRPPGDVRDFLSPCADEPREQDDLSLCGREPLERALQSSELVPCLRLAVRYALPAVTLVQVSEGALAARAGPCRQRIVRR